MEQDNMFQHLTESGGFEEDEVSEIIK